MTSTLLSLLNSKAGSGTINIPKNQPASTRPTPQQIVTNGVSSLAAKQAAQKSLIPQPSTNPIVKAADTFYGGVNDVGSLLGSLLGSVLPIGKSNIYSPQGRQSLVGDLANETYNPSTGKFFTTGQNAVTKVQTDASKGDGEALAGDLGASVLNATSLIPFSRGVSAAKALVESAPSAVKSVVTSGLTGAGFGAASGATSALQQDATPSQVATNALKQGAVGGVIGTLLPLGVKGATSLTTKLVPHVQKAVSNLNDEVKNEQATNLPNQVPVTHPVLETNANTPLETPIQKALPPVQSQKEVPVQTSSTPKTSTTTNTSKLVQPSAEKLPVSQESSISSLKKPFEANDTPVVNNVKQNVGGELNSSIPSHIYKNENLDLYRGSNDVNKVQANADRPVFHSETPDYAETYGKVTNKKVTGRVLEANNIHAYGSITEQLGKALGKYVNPKIKARQINGIEEDGLRGWLNHTLEGERLSQQFTKPMPEDVKKAFNDIGVDYIRIPGDQFKGTVGKVGHQTEVIEIPKPKSAISQPKSRGLTASVDPTTNKRGLTTSLQNSGNYSKELKKAISSQYAPATDKEALQNTQQFMKQGLNKAHDDVIRRLYSNEEANKQLVSDAGTVMQHLDADHRYSAAQEIHDKLAEKLTNAGQVSQATSLLLKRSPDGLYRTAVDNLTKAKVDITPEIDNQLKIYRENIRATVPDTPERNLAVLEMKQFVGKNIPSKLRNKVFAIWRAGLLTGGRTISKIGVSHVAQGTLERLKDIPASAVDKVISLANGGRRSLVNTNEGGLTGFKEGIKAGFGKNGYLRSGIDTTPGSNAVEFHQDVNFGNSVAGKIASGYTNGIGRLHGSIYKPFYGQAFKVSMYSQAKAAAKTAKVSAEDMPGFINNFINNPSHESLDTAAKDAEHATFQQETALGKGASQIQKIPVVGKYVAPFTRIPSAIATDVIDYSPVGAVKTIVKGIKDAKDGGWSVGDQRAFAQGLGRSITGTAALVPGYMLFQKGLVNLSYPTDKKEQAIWKAEGRTEDSVLIGGSWRSFGSLGPVGTVLEIGAGLAAGKQGATKGLSGAVGAAVSAGGVGLKSLEDQPYVQGITNLAAAIQDPSQFGQTLAKSYAGSVIPTGLGQIASAGDQSARQANTPFDTIKSKIPGLRETLPVSQTAFGQNVPNGESGPASFIDPFYSSKNIPADSTLNELQRLDNVGQGTVPEPQDTKNTFNGVPTQLTKVQAQSLSAQIGQTVKPLWDAAIANPSYKALSDDQKTKALADILSNTTSAVKDTYAQQNKLGQYAPGFTGKTTSLSAAQQLIQSGSKNIDDYLTGTANATSSIGSLDPKSTSASFLLDSSGVTPATQDAWNQTTVDPKYQSLVDNINSELPSGAPHVPNTNAVAKIYATFEKDKSDGNWSTLETQNKSQQVVEDAYKSVLTPQEQYASGLSDTAIKNAVSNGQITQDQMNHIIAVDNAVVQIGGAQNISNKTRAALGYGTTSSGSTSSSSKSTKSSAIAKSFAAAQKATNDTALSNEKALQSLLSGIKYTKQKKVKV